jgi:hypothetical protein
MVMKSFKTTIIGALIGGVVAIQPMLETGKFTLHDLVIGFLITAFGIVAKDFDVSTNKKE